MKHAVFETLDKILKEKFYIECHIWYISLYGSHSATIKHSSGEKISNKEHRTPPRPSLSIHPPLPTLHFTDSSHWKFTKNVYVLYDETIVVFFHVWYVFNGW